MGLGSWRMGVHNGKSVLGAANPCRARGTGSAFWTASSTRALSSPLTRSIHSHAQSTAAPPQPILLPPSVGLGRWAGRGCWQPAQGPVAEKTSGLAPSVGRRRVRWQGHRCRRDGDVTLPWVTLLCAGQSLLGHNQTKARRRPLPSLCFLHPVSVHAQARATQQTQANMHTPQSHAPQNMLQQQRVQAPEPQDGSDSSPQPPAHFLFFLSCMHIHVHVHTHTSLPRASTLESHIWNHLAHLAPTSLPFSCPSLGLTPLAHHLRASHATATHQAKTEVPKREGWRERKSGGSPAV